MRQALAALLLCAVTGCSVGTPPADDVDAPAQQTNVDVDTPELRQAKAEAGVEPCRPGRAGPASTDPLPDVTLPCLGGGEPVELDTLRGPMVINLFAQWCGPCRDELPYYQRLHEAGGDRVRVLGIDYLDTQPGGALALARETGVTFPLLADPAGELRGELRIRGLPGVVLVDEDGRAVHVEFRVIRSYDELTALVAEHLGVAL